jgi:arabinogalactan endo-1,4-beta-galactosidase
MQFFSPYDFNNKRAFDSKMPSLKKINIFKRIKYSEMLVRLQCHISEAFYKNSREKKKKPRRVLNLHSSVSKSNTFTNYTIVDSVCAQ